MFRMTRSEDLAIYINLTAYQMALEVQLNLLRTNLVRLRMAPIQMRTIVANELRRVATENRFAKEEIRILATHLQVPLPPSLR